MRFRSQVVTLYALVLLTGSIAYGLLSTRAASPNQPMQLSEEEVNAPVRSEDATSDVRIAGKSTTLQADGEGSFLEYKFYAGGVSGDDPYLTVSVHPSGKVEINYAAYTVRSGTYTINITDEQLADIFAPFLDADILLRDNIHSRPHVGFTHIDGTTIEVLHPSTSVFTFKEVSVSQNRAAGLKQTSEPRDITFRVVALPEAAQYDTDNAQLAALASLAQSLEALADTAWSQ